MQFTFTAHGPVSSTTLFEVTHVQKVNRKDGSFDDLFEVLETFHTSDEAMKRAQEILRGRHLAGEIDRDNENIVVMEKITILRRIR